MLWPKGRMAFLLTCLGVALALGGAAAPALAGGGPAGDINPELLIGPFIYGVATLEPEMGPWPGSKTVASGVKATFVGTFVPATGEKGVQVKFQSFFPTLPTFNFYQLTLEDLNFMFPGAKVLDLNLQKVQGLPILGDGKIYVKSFDSLSWDGNLPRATVHTKLSYGP
ncbi:MAG: hypothetical protein FJ121_02905 [Deltaproteobacteria bacterium]|nr:hypothetical protein [Deltaproteobacteria bacterium]